MAAVALMALNGFAADVLDGFAYEQSPKSPTGKEWESPEALALNKEQPTAYMFHFASEKEAKAVVAEKSSYWKSLDGTWKFHWVAKPEDRPQNFYKTDFNVKKWDDIEVPGCWNMQGLQKDGTFKYGVPIYVNIPVMFYHQRKVDDWKEGVMRPAPENWLVHKYPNEVGSYRRTFKVPSNWKGREVFINFDGVDSFFYLWINGHYVGFSKNSRNTATFNITPYIKRSDENVVAVEVYRSSDASFLESQDMFRLPGIIRSTYLTAAPKVCIKDLAVRTEELTADAKMDVQMKVSGVQEWNAENVEYKVYEVALYSDEIVKEVLLTDVRTNSAGGKVYTTFTMQQPQKWSAENPVRYVLTAALKNAKGQTQDLVSTYFGVRKVEIRETAAKDDEFGLAGRYFYVNNAPVKLKGVNRHETNPLRGHAITREQMEEEVMLMKRGNINHVRLSHYNNDPYWYYLADKYGLYLEDECNLESHQYGYGDASLSHPAEWTAAHIARNVEMVHAHVNHPSIVIWSLGNEAGPGKNFVEAYNAIRAYDLSRPVQYERNNDIVDMGSNQYPSIPWVRGAVKGNYNIKYPFHISEYAHSMGNAVGNLVDYWDAMESTNFFCGGAIWDWVDQAMITYNADGTSYMGYGGDHGDWPNDGMFCMNGVMLPDLSPKPQYWEVKKVYQNVGVTLKDLQKARFEVFNKNYFTSLDDYAIRCSLLKDGKVVEKQTFRMPRTIGPRERRVLQIPNMKLTGLDAGSEYFLNVEFVLRVDKPWAKFGYVQMNEQLTIQRAAEAPALAAKGGVTYTDAENTLTVTGERFGVIFDKKQGTIQTLIYDGKSMIGGSDKGPQLDAYRAPVDNDNWCRDNWFRNGLYDLKHTVKGAPVVFLRADSALCVSFNIFSQGEKAGNLNYRPGASGNPYLSVKDEKPMKEEDFHFLSNLIYTVYADGSIEMESSIASSNPSLALPRLGYALQLPKSLENYAYYGRGPENNYNDRKTGSFVGLYESTVEKQFVNFPKPQSMGNREEVRWCALTDKAGDGLQFISLGNNLSASALPYSAWDMTWAQHPYELPESKAVYLHLDAKVNGLGGNSCGQGGPLEQDCVRGALHKMAFVIRPVNAKTDLTANAKVGKGTQMPLSIIRDRVGKVSIEGEGTVASKIMYSLNGGAAQEYTTAIDMRQGGKIEAWYSATPGIKTTLTYTAIENVPVVVAYASSQENDENAGNLVDGNPSTIWHTMYSITVTKYPHWIDFDCSETKTLKGFTYLPRQEGSNGDIKKYKVQVSNDGKTWSEAVAEGSFERSKKEQKVVFKKPVKGRYLRFTALSSQDGQDFASGAEFSVLAE